MFNWIGESGATYHLEAIFGQMFPAPNLNNSSKLSFFCKRTVGDSDWEGDGLLPIRLSTTYKVVVYQPQKESSNELQILRRVHVVANFLTNRADDWIFNGWL